jgi:hypothetical protein
VIAMLTVPLSPEAMPQAPPTLVTAVFVLYGKLLMVPLTVVSVTTGALASIVMVWAPLVPPFPAASPWVAVTV